MLIILGSVVLALIISVVLVSTRIHHEVNEVTGITPTMTRLKPPPIFLSTIEPEATQNVVALTIVTCLFAALLTLIPFGDWPLPSIANFTPIIDASLCGMLGIIAYILIGQFLRLRSWSLLLLVSGFIYKMVLALLHALIYPGFFFANAEGVSTILWLYATWHAGFPLFVMAYAYFHKTTPRKEVYGRASVAVVLALTITTVCAALLFSAITMADGSLPTLINNDDAYMLMANGIGPVLLMLNIMSLMVLWKRSDSVLDLWLMVSVCASIGNIALTAFISKHRYDVGYYAGWMFELISAGVILGALMEEMNRLYSSLYSMMEQQQKESTAQYRAIVDTAIDAVIVIDQHEIVQSLNPAARIMFGYDPDEVIGRNILMLMAPHNTEATEHQIIGVGRELQGRRKDGTNVAAELTVAEWYSGEEKRFTCMLRDISDRKRIENQLIQSQKMEAIGQLTGGMAHDFNNLLGVIMGNLDMLAEHFPEGQPDELKDALEASSAGADLVRRLLAFARRQPLQAKSIHTEHVVQDLLPLASRIIGDYIVIATHFDDDLWPVMADPAQFENAVLNLIINSRDAMPRGGTLVIECKNETIDELSSPEYDMPSGDYAVLIVTDTGIGIPKEIMSHIFEPFFTTKPPGQGSGLGLSMVYGYAKQSGGAVRIYSEVGKGTAVRMYLPATNIKNGDGSASDHIDDVSIPHGNERILIVEDTAAARIIAKRILTSLGYAVQLASDAAEALAILDTDKAFDMLFTDIVMPGMDGVELARVVKDRLPRIRILLASGFSRTPSQDIEALNARYITKPYRKAELAKTIRDMLERRHSELS